MYFLTHVTYHRMPLLVENYDLLKDALDSTLGLWETQISAWVVLPDHIHMIVNPGSADLSHMMKRLKLSFSARYRKRRNAQGGRVWQNRFWDHVIRDEDDLRQHVDYIHYNPVKHGLVANPFEWKLSSIGTFLEQGYYAEDWGLSNSLTFNGDYGE